MDSQEFSENFLFLCGNCNKENEMKELKKETDEEIEKFCCSNCGQPLLINKGGKLSIGKCGGAIIDK